MHTCSISYENCVDTASYHLFTPVSYQTDHNMNASGWNMTYSQSSCGGYLAGPTDVITSPGYPASYPNNAHCAWLLNYEDGSQINVRWHYNCLLNKCETC